MKVTRLQICFLVLELLGVVALFLPFTCGISPWDSVAMSVRDREFLGPWVIGITLFLALVVWLFGLRSLLPKPPTKAGNWRMIILAILGLAIPFVFWLIVFFSSSTEERRLFVVLVSLYLFIPVVLTLAVRRKLSFTTAAPVALRCAYLLHAMAMLYCWSGEFTRVSDLQIGAAFVAATVVLYLVEIVYFTRQGLKQRLAVVSQA